MEALWATIKCAHPPHPCVVDRDWQQERMELWNCGSVFGAPWSQHSLRESLTSLSSNPSHPLRYYFCILYVYFFNTGLGSGLFMGLLVVCLLVFRAFFPPFFISFKTGVALNNQPLFHIQSEMIDCRANQNYF